MDSTDYLDTPYRAGRYAADLQVLLDEQTAMISHYQRNEARRAANRKALRDFCGLLAGLALFAAIVWLGVR